MDREKYLQEISQSQGKLLGFINFLHCNHSESQDILQDTNITLIRKWGDFDKSRKFLPWALAIARFTWRAHKKKRAIELKNMLYDSHVTNILLNKEDKALKWQINYDMEVERLRILDIGRKSLTNKQRLLLDSLLNGKTIQEIADEYGCTYGAVQTLKSRTLNKIKDTVLRIKYNPSIYEEPSVKTEEEKIPQEECNSKEIQKAPGRDTFVEESGAVV